MPHNIVLGIPNHTSLLLAGIVAAVALGSAVWLLTSPSHESSVHPSVRSAAASGWLPVACLGVFALIVLACYGTPIRDIAIFGVYVTLGLAVPGMLWVRLLRGRTAHVAEDMALGLGAGYCIEIATYVVARAVGAPLLFLLWPISTLAIFAAVPALRRYWRGDAARVQMRWSWSIAAILGYLLIYSAGTFFVSHHLTGTDTPYVDMPFHLALVGELLHHVPPQIPYVSGVSVSYHWFFYADAAATSWATGIEPVTLLYRLSGLPMFVTFVVLTATTAQRLTACNWSGPVAVAVALFGTVASPYAWAGKPVFDTQTLALTWISPTNLLGLALFASILPVFIDLVQADANPPRRYWLLLVLLVFGCAGAKASLLPLLIVGILAVVAGVAIRHHRLHRRAAVGLAAAGIGLLLAEILLYRGSTGGAVIGLDSLRSLPVVDLAGAHGADGLSSFILPMVGLLVALVLWSFLWAGAYGLVAGRRGSDADAPILLLAGAGAGALGVVAMMSYPGLSQVYYLTAAAGVFGILSAVGIARVTPPRTHYLPLAICVSAAALIGAVAVLLIRKLGPTVAPTFAKDHLASVLLPIAAPILALVGMVCIAGLVLRFASPRRSVLQGAIPLLVIAVAIGFSLPNVVGVLESPMTYSSQGNLAVPGDGIAAARWLRDHSDTNDLVATNLHCALYTMDYATCNPISFWVSAYTERHVLVEGWAYTTKSAILSSGQVAPFWDQALLAANDAAFADPSGAAVAKLRDSYGVRWLLADLSGANADSLGLYADLRYRKGSFGVYELRAP